MAAPTFVNSAVGDSTAGQFTVTLPAHQAGDVLLAITWYRASATVATPTDWTQAATWLRGTSRYYVHWLRATSGAETNPLFDYTGTDDGYGMVAVYRGVAAGSPPYDVLGATATGTANPATLTGITTLVADALVVALIGGEDNTGTGATMTATDPAAFTEHYDESATGTDGCVAIGEASRATAGATGNVSCNFGATVVGWGGLVLSLPPEVSSDGTGTPAGVETASALGSSTATGTATAPVSGVETASAVGTVSATGTATASVTGVEATAAIGSVTASGESPDGTATASGVEATSAIGSVAAIGDALAAATGVEAVSAIGDVTAAGESPDGTATVIGVEAVAAIGTVAATGDARALADGVEVVSAIGDALAVGDAVDATAVVTGVEVVSAIGDVEVVIQAFDEVRPLRGTSWHKGAPFGAVSIDATAHATGVQAVASVGVVSPRASARALASGVLAFARPGDVSARGAKNPSDFEMLSLILQLAA
jgi:hypothetical protein